MVVVIQIMDVVQSSICTQNIFINPLLTHLRKLDDIDAASDMNAAETRRGATYAIHRLWCCYIAFSDPQAPTDRSELHSTHSIMSSNNPQVVCDPQVLFQNTYSILPHIQITIPVRCKSNTNNAFTLQANISI